MTSDRDAILICLTGTPIIGELASKKIFGDYFHKYYYDASIADGYTLRLIREEIETSYRASLSDVLAQFEIQKGELDKSSVLAHKNFVNPMLEYILSDLKRSRMLHNDQTIGGMVVCDSSDQAREMQSQFKEKFSKTQELTSALILFDAGTKDERKKSVEEFKDGLIDILFVYNMLLTGFDAPRLKKLYMGRVVRDHNLLQALTRVNRPYKNFKFGYIVDFADIRKEFEITNAAYFAELRDELGEEVANYSHLFLTKEEIEEAVEKIRSDLFMYNIENAEEFSKQVSAIQDKKTMRSIVSSLHSGRDIFNLIRLMNIEDLQNIFDFKQINLLLTEATNHLSLLHLRDKVENADETRFLLNSALEDVVFMFRKDSEQELRIGEMRGRTRQVREALEHNIDKRDPDFLSLFEELRRILNKSNIAEDSIVDIDADILDLVALLARAKDLNLQNQHLASKYSGDAKFVRIHKGLKNEARALTDIQIFELLDNLRNHLNDVVQSNEHVLNNQKYFEGTIESALALIFVKNSLYEQHIDIGALKLRVASEYFNEYEGAAA
jgi:type I restriction enzyme R subunit